MYAIPERLRGVITTRRYINPCLPLPLPLTQSQGKVFSRSVTLTVSYDCIVRLACSSCRFAVQDVPSSDVESHRPDVNQSREAQTAPHPHHVHQRTAQGAREGVRRDALPGHLHARGDRHEDRPH